jgi:hypothetical protein
MGINKFYPSGYVNKKVYACCKKDKHRGRNDIKSAPVIVKPFKQFCLTHKKLPCRSWQFARISFIILKIAVIFN